MKINFIDLQAQYTAYQDEINASIQKVLDHGRFIMGPEIKELETALESYLDSPHAITCANGTDALLLAMMAMEIGPGDEVITTPFTFISTATMIRLLGATPVFVDIDQDTYNISAGKIAEKVNDKTKAIIAVSLYGQPADMVEINAVADQASQKIYVIEDAAQSFGAEYQGKKSCNLSEVATTSFFPSKPLGCYGDGGAIFTTNEMLAERMKSLRVHGQTQRYHHEFLGINGRMDTIQAAITLVKLKHLDEEVARRMEIGNRYSKLLSTCDVVTPHIKTDRTSVFAQYSVRAKDRDKILTGLKSAGVPTAIHYPTPLHLQPCFADLDYKVGDFPIAEKISKEIFSLPMSAFLTQEQQDCIVGNFS